MCNGVNGAVGASTSNPAANAAGTAKPAAQPAAHTWHGMNYGIPGHPPDRP